MKNLKAIIFMVILFFALNGNSQGKNEVYLFSYFVGNGEDGLHLAFSIDGLNWEALKSNSSFLTPKVGIDKLMEL